MARDARHCNLYARAMRTLLTSLLFLMVLAGPARAETAWLPVPVDKAAHFGLSYVMTDQLLRAGLPPAEALAIAFFVGWFKEVADGRIDPGDLGADAAGCLAAAFVRVQFHW